MKKSESAQNFQRKTYSHSKNEVLRPQFYQSIADILNAARSNAYRAINFCMVEAYWNVGR